jgi:hypothetical protein
MHKVYKIPQNSLHIHIVRSSLDSNYPHLLSSPDIKIDDGALILNTYVNDILSKTVYLINGHFTRGGHHWRWRAATDKLLLGACGLWTERNHLWHSYCDTVPWAFGVLHVSKDYNTPRRRFLTTSKTFLHFCDYLPFEEGLVL